MSNILDVEPDIEIEPEIEPEPESDIEPDPEQPAPSAALAPIALMQVLPADFPLPSLIRFVPDMAIKARLDAAVTYALSIDVSAPEGLQRADLAATELADAIKAAEAHFEEPAALSNQLHKHITGVRAEWVAPAQSGKKTISQRIYTEKARLDAIEREARRKAQEEADRRARETARKEAEKAAAAQAPAPVVEQLKRQAETATAPPVPVSMPAQALRGVSTVTTWKARIAGTPACDEPIPDTEKLSPAQQLEVMKLLKAIIDGRAPMAAIQLNASYLHKRAKADKSTLQIPGVEAFEEGGIRSKGTRAK